ncbi:hypothetical protein BGX38DRAFT_1276210 [Terfezia claveryi]|nr:hypothetical protein BGX38DRAFT_1276210 [Terfezia claveryi]
MSDAARPTRKVHIDYSAALIPSSRVRSSHHRSLLAEGGCILTPHLEDGPDRMAKKPSRVGPRSRSFFTIPEQYKELTTRAASHVHCYTLFANLMLNAEEIQQLLSVSWIKAQEDTGQELERVKIANMHLRSIHSRTRSHLVYECKHNIIEVFGLSKLPQHEIAKQVKYLLLKDRLICRADGRETHQRHFRASEITDVIFCKYFASVKMHRNFDETFFDSINEVFICLVTSAMRPCLKSWTTGVYVKPPITGDFKYDTSICQQATQLARQRIPNGMWCLAHAEEDEDHSLDDEY